MKIKQISHPKQVAHFIKIFKLTIWFEGLFMLNVFSNWPTCTCIVDGTEGQLSDVINQSE